MTRTDILRIAVLILLLVWENPAWTALVLVGLVIALIAGATS